MSYLDNHIKVAVSEYDCLEVSCNMLCSHLTSAFASTSKFNINIASMV